MAERAKNDPEAFALLYDLHFHRIYSYAYHHTGSHHDAEDITAQTFQQARQHLASYQGRGVPFACWLYRIASNLMLYGGRKTDPQTDLEGSSTLRSLDPLPEDVILRRERARDLRSAVMALPASQQQVVMLKFSQGLRNRQIGAVIGRSEGAVKLLLHRALRGLREKIAQDHG